MYRIIGIDKSNRFKVIKKEALNAAYKWHSLYKINTTWAQSDLKANLNGSIFLTNSGYMPRGWADKIETVNWKYGDIYDASNPNNATNVTAAGMVQKEQAWTTTTSAKIGLIYLADYYFAYHKNGLNCGLSGESSTCKTNWMHLAQNDTSAPVAAEWVISRYGYYSNNGYVAWNIYSSGAVNYSYSNFEYSIRPVFYLKSNIEITGTGTQTDPYIIVN